jgi:purine catabolism regulator
MTSLAANPTLTLGDLLDSDELGLKLVAGGADASTRALRGAHCVELLHPAGELDREWLLLTTGLQLGDSVGMNEEFVIELAEAGVAGMGFALGPVHGRIPAGIVTTAERIGFPVFTVPSGTPLRHVASTVFQAIACSDVRASRRLASIQRSLIGSLADDQPRQRLLRMLASQCGAQVGLVGARGQLDFQTTPLPAEVIGHCLARGSEAIRYFDIAGHYGFALPVVENGARACEWLVLTWPARRSVPALAEPAARMAAPLLGAISRLSHAERNMAREVRRGAFETLLEPDGGDNSRSLDARCRACGIKLSGGVRVVAITEGAERVVGSWLDEFEGALERTRTPFMVAEKGDAIAVLLPAAVSDRFITDTLLALGPKLLAGVGRAVSDGPAVASSWADAELAVKTQTRCSSASITRYDDLGLDAVLLNEIRIDRLLPKIRQLVKPLAENPAICETLVAYLRHDQDVGRTARALNVHPNSVRYRLTRAELLLGVSIRASSTIVALHLAFGFSGDAYRPDGDPDCDLVGPSTEASALEAVTLNVAQHLSA